MRMKTYPGGKEEADVKGQVASWDQNSHHVSEKGTSGWVRGQTCPVSENEGPKVYGKN